MNPTNRIAELEAENAHLTADNARLHKQQKVSGCFRSEGGDAFARLRGYWATLRNQGQALLLRRQTVFAGVPLYPDFV